MATEQSVNPGDVVLYGINLTGQNGQQYNIQSQCLAVNIYESIMSPTLYAEFYIWDTVDFMNTIPIRGEETINIQFSTPGAQTPRNMTFSVVKPDFVRTSIFDQDKRYTLRCVTADHLNGVKNKFSQSYNDTIPNIVQSIISNQIGSQLPFSYEPTKGTNSIIVPKLYPFQAIDFLRRRSVSAQYLSSTYHFYQDKTGYNFHSLEYLMSQNRQNVGDQIFFYDSSALEDLASITFRNILGYHHLGHGDAVSSIAGGNFSSQTNYLDFFRKSYSNTSWNNISQQSNFQFPDASAQPFNSSQFETQYNSGNPQQFLLPRDTSQPENYIYTMIGPKQSYLKKIGQNIVRFKVYGDSDMTVGNVMTVQLPNVTGLTSQPEEAQLMTGNYLISKIRHMISLAEKRNYSLSLEAIKGSVYSN